MHPPTPKTPSAQSYVSRHDFSDHQEPDLIMAAVRGDQSAFCELCRRHSGCAKRAVIRIARNREDAEDALMRAHNPGEILTPNELAARLKVPVSWIYEKQRTRCKNPIPSKPKGRYVRFDWDEVTKWLENLSNAPGVSSKVSGPRNKRA